MPSITSSRPSSGKRSDITHCVVFDLGAGSGRAMLARFENGHLFLQEIDRFDDLATTSSDGPRWNVEAINRNILNGLRKANDMVGQVDAIGIDSWGLDYALLGADGSPVTLPYHYRNPRSLRGHEACPLTKDRLFAATGAQSLPVITVFQLYDELKHHPERFDGNPQVLMMADLVCNFLTGEARSEVTLARTSGLLEPEGRGWSLEVLETLGVSTQVFGPLIRPGEIYGYVRQEIADRLGWGTVPVVAVAAHDTASAVAGLPLREDEAFVICGSWALVGAEVDNIELDPEILEAGFGYEGGAEGRPFLVRSLSGLHLVNGLRRSWRQRTGSDVTFAEIGKAVAELAVEDVAAIDASSPLFFNPSDVVDAVNAYHEQQGGRPLSDVGSMALSIYKGLVADIAKNLAFLEKRRGRPFSRIRVCGGGGQDTTFCRLLANALGHQVVVGPIEASAWGNAMLQLVGIGCVISVAEGRGVVAASAEFLEYEPSAQFGSFRE